MCIRKSPPSRTSDDALDVTDELIDRFGDPPGAVQGLIDVALVRGRAAALGIREIAQRDQGMFLYPERVDMTLASGLASTLKGRVMVGASGQKPYYLVRPKAGQNPIAAIEEALAAMESALPAPAAGN